jgi:hypothetical protein
MTQYYIYASVNGETPGSAGESLIYPYGKIKGASPRITFQLSDVTGVISYEWELVGKPYGATATLINPTTSAPYIDPDADKPGTYFIKCTINGGGSDDALPIGVSFKTKHRELRIPSPEEGTEFDSDYGWAKSMHELFIAADSAGHESRLKKVINIIDCTASPPTENDGDRYILDTTGSVNAGWDGAAQNDVVEFDSSSGFWIANTPVEGAICYVDSLNLDYQFVDDGSPVWEARPNVLGYPSDAIVIVQHGSSFSENETYLNTAYTNAKALTPSGQALSETNRALVILPSGSYNLTSKFSIDTDFVDFLGHGTAFRNGNIDDTTTIVKPNSRLYGNFDDTLVEVTARDVRLTRIHFEQQYANAINMLLNETNGCDRVILDNVAFTSGATKGPSIKVDDTNNKAAGTFKDCHADSNFITGVSPVFSGTCINCSANASSFGDTGTMTGKVIDSQCYGNSFGTGSSAAILKNVTNLGRTSDFTFSGHIEDCRFQGACAPVITLGAGANLFKTVVEANGEFSVDAVSSTSEVYISQCMLNYDVSADVLNGILQGYNIISTKISLPSF